MNICGQFVGGFEIDPCKPNICQVCEHPRDEHGSGGRALAKRLGNMADALVSAKVGPQARFFTRQCVDELVMLLREAEKRILETANQEPTR